MSPDPHTDPLKGGKSNPDPHQGDMSNLLSSNATVSFVVNRIRLSLLKTSIIISENCSVSFWEPISQYLHIFCWPNQVPY